MRVFVTGATGFIGTALVRELLDHGHTVLGLTRSEEGAKALEAAGADVHRGNIDDLESIRTGAAGADAVAHLAFNHDFSDFAKVCDTDRRVIETIGATLAGSKPADGGHLRARRWRPRRREARHRSRPGAQLEADAPRGVRRDRK